MNRLLVVGLAALLAPSVRAERPLRVLTNASMLGKGSLGELIQARFQGSCRDCRVEFVESKDLAGLLGRLRAARRQGRLEELDVVLGIEGDAYRNAVVEGLVVTGQLFDKAPYAIVVDARRLPPKQWPKSWRELATSPLRGKLLIEDPRLSSAGYGWLRAIFQLKLMTPKEAGALVGRVFPSWSAAYAAFLQGEGAGVWTYQTSEAYHRCRAKDAGERDHLRVLPLAEGYPVQEEWAAAVKRASGHPRLKAFLALLDSDAIQAEIPETNWMFPARAGIKLPKCFEGLSPVIEKTPAEAPTPAQTRDWLDAWSLI